MVMLAPVLTLARLCAEHAVLWGSALLYFVACLSTPETEPGSVWALVVSGGVLVSEAPVSPYS